MGQRSVLFVVAVGIIFHLVYITSIFDIYFRSPVVHGITPGKIDPDAPARRLVLFVADGLRADKFFELHGPQLVSRAPYLRKILETRGAWGVSHTRVPTESRPGHVAMIAGLYEDVSAVTRGWKSNPVEFDSFFNQTAHTWAFGSPDILPMFAIGVPHVETFMYGAETEDFKGNASRLDIWVFDKVEQLFEEARRNATLATQLRQERVAIFLHLLGTDTIGHESKPQSQQYLENIRFVDSNVQRIVDIIDQFYDDHNTAYIFTADHGMHDKGSHGDGDPQNTETPLVCWGAGLDGPRQQNFAGWPRVLSDPRWALDHLVRRDVQQADIAPLMSALVGAPYPVNSVGRLPYLYLHGSDAFKTRKLLENAEQIAKQLRRKAQMRQERSSFFTPFSGSSQVESLLATARYHLHAEDHQQARDVIAQALELLESGLQYFQKYDWTLLMSVITAGYFGWIVNVALFFAQRQSSAPVAPHWWRCSLVVPVAFGVYFLAQRMPLMNYLYTLFPAFFWIETLRHYRALVPVIRSVWQNPLAWLCRTILVLMVLEVLVIGFFERGVLSCCLVLMSFAYFQSEGGSNVLWASSCIVTSLFLLLPIDLTLLPGYLVYIGGALMLLAIPIFVKWSGAHWDRYWILYMVMLALSLGLVYHTSMCFEARLGLPLANQILSWLVLIASLVLLGTAPANGPSEMLVTRLAAMVPAFVLFAISYEVLFLLCFAAVLFFWLRNEVPQRTQQPLAALCRSELNVRFMRNTIFFLVLGYVALFGTGNIASISSFEVQSCYRFLTVFDPFVMAALILCKLLLPFLLLACSFASLNAATGVSAGEGVLAVVAASDVMSLNFFFLVRDSGSWQDIGMSIGHFCIVNSMVIFQLLFLYLADALLRRVLTRKSVNTDRKDSLIIMLFKMYKSNK